MPRRPQRSSQTPSAKTYPDSENLAPRPFVTPTLVEEADARSPKTLPATQALEGRTPEFLMFADGGRSLPLQPKLTIGAPNDKYEQEADRVAEQVVQRLSMGSGGQSANGKTPPSQPNQALQRETLPEEEDELQMKPLAEQIQRMDLPEDDELQMKPLLQREVEPDEEDELQMKPDALQREVDPDEEDELQMKPLLQRQGSGAVAASDDLESAIQQSRGGGQPLADSIREPMEQAFGGVDFRGVNVHTDGRSDQLNQSIQAKAFTTGQDIYFRQGAYQPGSQSGQKLIAHELTHVMQQNGLAIQAKQQPDQDSEWLSRAAQSASFIQAKLMTDKELVEATGVRGARIRAGSSYERLVEFLKDYRHLNESDPEAKQVNKRLQILQSIETEARSWTESDARTKVKKGDDKKLVAISKILHQVHEERSALNGIQEQLEKPQTHRDSRGRRGAFLIGYTSQSENEREAQATKEAESSKGFWGKVKDKLVNFFHYTFGLDFTLEQGVSLQGQHLNPEEIQEILRRMDKAEADYKELVSAGVSPVNALAIVYRYVPEQIKPKSPALEEHLAIKVKRQYLEENLNKVKNKTSIEAEVQEYIGYGNHVTTVANISHSGAKMIRDPQKHKVVVLKQFEEAKGGIGLGGGVIKVAESIAGIVDGGKKYSKAETEVEKQEAIDILHTSAQNTTMAIGDINQGIGTIIGLGEALPVVSILTTLQKLIVDLGNGTIQVIRAVKQHQLGKQAKEQVSALTGAIKRLGKRNIHLMLRTGADILAKILSIVGDLLGGPTNPYGGAVKAISTVVSGLNSAASMLVDSYQAGLAQETENRTHAGEKGTAVKVFDDNSNWAVTGLILEAREGNQLAIDTLEVYGINQKMMDELKAGKTTVAAIRKYVLGQLKEQEELQTITQKARKAIRGR